jgi:hypothetical protein
MLTGNKNMKEICILQLYSSITGTPVLNEQLPDFLEENLSPFWSLYAVQQSWPYYNPEGHRKNGLSKRQKAIQFCFEQGRLELYGKFQNNLINFRKRQINIKFSKFHLFSLNKSNRPHNKIPDIQFLYRCKHTNIIFWAEISVNFKLEPGATHTVIF